MYKKVDLPHGSFPVFDKVDVNGPNSLPAYRYLKKFAPKLPGCAGCDIAWNYEKFLVNGDGVPVARYAAATSPLEAEATIAMLLSA
jgi:glutathione peroxidase|mmetsp:Transcript_36784/g.83254  ORF Transcript_36784/g.83254 Transcript_36784/m.83254 type:complete len:86 (-) Transcript_36784:418-675(-)